jgi:hypothetical protein
MKIGTFIRAFVGVFAICAAPILHAQTTAGSGTFIVIPAVAQTASYITEIFARNPNATTLTLDVLFYEANTSAVPGLRPCSQLVLTSGQTLSFTLAGQCTLGAGVHHGMLILQDAAVEKINVFYAYSRTQTPQGNGFSIEGFPVGNFSGASANVVGLKRSAAGAKYQTNCFGVALGEPVDYQITLFNGATNTQLGNPVTGSLQPYQMIRHLDIFTAAGAPAGDYSNVRANFNNTNAGEPALVGFCTVQESVTFGADFRIAKSQDASDQRQKRLVCYSSADCINADVGSTQIVPDPVDPVNNQPPKNIHYLLIAQPDFVKCSLVSPHLTDLEIRLRAPGDVFASPVFVPSPPFAANPPYTAGGNDALYFYIFTGHRNAVNNGTVTRWYIDVSFRETSDRSLLPVDYGIICNSGNGVSVPWFRAQAADDF